MSLKWLTFQAITKQAYHQDDFDFHITENTDWWDSDSDSDSFTRGSTWKDEDRSSKEWDDNKDVSLLPIVLHLNLSHQHQWLQHIKKT